MKRFFNPALNPTGLTGLGFALYALGTGIWNVVHHHGALDPAVVIAALTAFSSTVSHMMVTPVRQPRDGNGAPLVPAAGGGSAP